MKEFREYLKALNIEDIFKNKNRNISVYITEIQESGDLAVVRLKGSIDAYTIPIIRANLGSKVEKYLDKNILLDFKEVSHTDSSTLASLLEILNALKENHNKLGLVNVNPTFRAYIEIVRLESIVHIYDTMEEALEDMNIERKGRGKI